MGAFISNKRLISEYLDETIINYFYRKFAYDPKDLVLAKVVEVLKYLLLADNMKGSDIPFNTELDDVWHLWILQTKQYSELMQRLPHKTFIHHYANEYVELEPKNITLKDRINTQFSYLLSYMANFGPFTGENIVFYSYAMVLLKKYEFRRV